MNECLSFVYVIKFVIITMVMIMKCANCGAEINENELICPYCGYENEKVAIEEQANYLNELEKKKENLNYEPERKAKRAEKKTNYVFRNVLILVSIIGFIAFGVVYFTSSNSLNKQNKNIEKLEEYYQERDYESISNLMDKIEDSYVPAYKKYYITASLYNGSQWELSIMEENYDYYNEGISRDSFDEEIEYVFKSLCEMKEYEDDGYKYEESDVVEYYRDLYYKSLEEVGMLSEEEIDDFVDNRTDSKTIASIILERWGSNQ